MPTRRPTLFTRALLLATPLAMVACTGELTMPEGASSDPAMTSGDVTSPGDLPGDTTARANNGQGTTGGNETTANNDTTPNDTTDMGGSTTPPDPVVEEATPILALSADGSVAISEDEGSSWEDVTLPTTFATLHGGLWVDGKAWIYGEGPDPLLTSVDGRTWSAVDVGDIPGLSGLARGDERFMAVWRRSVLLSSDGETWERVNDIGKDDDVLLDVAHAQGTFVVVGEGVLGVSTGMPDEDGGVFETLRTWERGISPRVVTDGRRFVRTHDRSVSVSTDGLEWDSERLCDEDGRTPTTPVFGPKGTLLAMCEGDLEVSVDWGDDWRRVGLTGGTRRPLLFADGVYHGADDEGFWRSSDALHWEPAEGEARDVVAMVYLGELAPPEPPPSLSCDTEMCMDFESELAGLPPVFHWGLKTGDESLVAIDDTFAFQGTKSMRVTVPADEGGNRGMIRFAGEDFPEKLSTKLYGRMMFYTEAYPVRNWHMAEASGVLDEGPEAGSRANYNIGGESDRAFHNYFIDGFKADCWNKSDVTYPAGRWFCWQVEVDRARDTIVISIDGQEAHRMDGTGEGCLGSRGADFRWEAPTIDAFTMGYNPFKPQEQELTAWIDDIVVDDEPVACPNPSP